MQIVKCIFSVYVTILKNRRLIFFKIYIGLENEFETYISKVYTTHLINLHITKLKLNLINFMNRLDIIDIYNLLNFF